MTCVTRVLGTLCFALCAREATVTRADDVAFENVAESSGDRFLDEKIAQREHRRRRQATNLSSDLLKDVAQRIDRRDVLVEMRTGR